MRCFVSDPLGLCRLRWCFSGLHKCLLHICLDVNLLLRIGPSLRFSPLFCFIFWHDLTILGYVTILIFFERHDLFNSDSGRHYSRTGSSSAVISSILAQALRNILSLHIVTYRSYGMSFMIRVTARP